MPTSRRHIHRLPLVGFAAALVVSCRTASGPVVHAGPARGGVPVEDARAGSARDASVRWEIAELIRRLNGRDGDDLQVRYRWSGGARVVQSFWRLISAGDGPTDLKARLQLGWDVSARRAVDSLSVNALGGESVGAMGGNPEGLDLAVRAEWSNGAGVPRSQIIPMHVEFLYDGQRAWISVISVREAVRW